ncbi:hypothetical protein [Sarcina ventriculi]|uniref:Uncharacterized protein n=1 Tax=Sarcina ventriculi TaxID=1267 RepID=A0ABP2AVV2_SARVE|nr:hypothetical protein [Sarcina ventriculi]MBU5323260.1 hypothetical protein [Sarcina ventriculi]MDO4402249.1 hypothetical protein [Clostridiaceae bacterium]CUO21458.1 Uncharacterised protein [Sarcina ventriculi]
MNIKDKLYSNYNPEKIKSNPLRNYKNNIFNTVNDYDSMTNLLINDKISNEDIIHNKI